MQMLIMTNSRQPNSGKPPKIHRMLWYHPYCVPNPNLLFHTTCIPKRQNWVWECHKTSGCDNYRKNERSKEDKGWLLLSLTCPDRKFPDLISHKQVIIQRWPKMLNQGNVCSIFSQKQQLCPAYEQAIGEKANSLCSKKELRGEKAFLVFVVTYFVSPIWVGDSRYWVLCLTNVILCNSVVGSVLGKKK